MTALRISTASFLLGLALGYLIYEEPLDAPISQTEAHSPDRSILGPIKVHTGQDQGNARASRNQALESSVDGERLVHDRQATIEDAVEREDRSERERERWRSRPVMATRRSTARRTPRSAQRSSAGCRGAEECGVFMPGAGTGDCAWRGAGDGAALRR